jgi:hypothetical protein
LVTASVFVSGVAAGADGASRQFLFAKLGWVAEFAAVTALGDEGGRVHFFAFSGSREETDGIFEVEGFFWCDRNNYRSGSFLTVGRVRFKESGSIDSGARREPNGVSHGVEELGWVIWEDVNGEVVDRIINCGGG